MARASLHVKFKLLRGSTDEICNRKLSGDGTLHRGRHANFIAQRWASRGHSAGPDCGCYRASGCRMPGRIGLCKRGATWAPGDFWNLAFCVRFAHRRNVGGQRRAGASQRRMRTNASLLRFARRRCGGDRGCKTSRYASRLGAGNLKCNGWLIGAEYGL